MRRTSGFSLIELLIVIAIIGIIAAIAVPKLIAARRSSNESSAIGNLRTIGSAEATYLINASRSGTFSDLKAQRLLDSSWSTGEQRSGYVFDEVAVVASQGTFHFTAQPSADGNGSRSFSITEDQVLRYQSGIVAISSGAGTAVGAQ